MAFDVSPAPDCPACPRLAAFRAANRKAFPDWSNAPVSLIRRGGARLLIVGLAPGLRGANRTGRPFTGDYAGDILYATLIEFGFASGQYDRRPDDGLSLVDCAIVNAVRCVPPQNKPTPNEIATCRPFLPQAIAALGNCGSSLRLAALRTKVRCAPFVCAHRYSHSSTARGINRSQVGLLFSTVIIARATIRIPAY